MSMTVSNGNGRVSVLDLPTLGAPAAGDTVVGVQGGVVGRFSAASFSGGTALSSTQYNQLEGEIQSVKNSIPDVSGLATSKALSDETAAREQAIAGISIPDVSGFVTTKSLATILNDYPTTTQINQAIANAEQSSSSGSSGSSSGSGTSSSGSAASIIGYGYYNDGSGTFVHKPIYQLFLTLRSPGGAGNQGTISFPDGFEFMDVPHVALQSCDLSASDFASGNAATPVDGSLGNAPGWLSVTNSALVFKHSGGWPGWSTEVMTFVLTGFRKE